MIHESQCEVGHSCLNNFKQKTICLQDSLMKCCSCQSDQDHRLSPLHAPHQRLSLLRGIRLSGHWINEMGLLWSRQRVSTEPFFTSTSSPGLLLLHFVQCERNHACVNLLMKQSSSVQLDVVRFSKSPFSMQVPALLLLRCPQSDQHRWPQRAPHRL